MEKQPKLKKYKFSTWDEKGKNREIFILCFYSNYYFLEYDKKWQSTKPTKNIQVYLGY